MSNKKVKLNLGAAAKRSSSPDEDTPQSGNVKSFNFLELIHSDLVEGDNKQAMVDMVLKTLVDNDALSLVFEWNPIGLKAFLEKVDKLPASATPTPPAFENIRHTVGEVRSRMLMAGILTTIKEYSGCDVIDGKDGIVGICGPPGPFFLALGCLTSMHVRNDWVSEVLATLPPLEPPLAALHTPLKADGTTRRWKFRYQHVESMRVRVVLWDL
jgi:hypothetical protein